MFSNKNTPPVSEQKEIELLDDAVGEDAIAKLEQNNANMDDLDLALENATLDDGKLAQLSAANESNTEPDWDEVDTPMSQPDNQISNVSEQTVQTEQEQFVLSQNDEAANEVEPPNREQREAPELIDTNQTNTATKPVKAKTHWGVKTSMLAVLLTVGGVGAYVFMNHDQVKSQFEQLQANLLQISTYAGATRTTQDELKESIAFISKLSSTLQSNQEKTNQALSDITTKINDIQVGVRHNTRSIEAQKNELLEIGERIRLVENGLKTTSVKLTGQVSDIRNTLTKQVTVMAADPVYNTANQIGDATLESVDLWNGKQYVNLRKPDGVWVALKLKDEYQGWTVTMIKGNKVSFRKAGKNKELTAKG